MTGMGCSLESTAPDDVATLNAKRSHGKGVLCGPQYRSASLDGVMLSAAPTHESMENATYGDVSGLPRHGY